MGVSADVIARVVRDFRGLPHRMVLVREVLGVRYYDDSKGTNVGATIAALRGLGRRAVLILGGEGKGQDFSLLRPAEASAIRMRISRAPASRSTRRAGRTWPPSSHARMHA